MDLCRINIRLLGTEDVAAYTEIIFWICPSDSWTTRICDITGARIWLNYNVYTHAFYCDLSPVTVFNRLNMVT